MHDFDKVVAGGLLVFYVVIIIGGFENMLFSLHAERDYQQKALNNGLDTTVVEMKQTGKYSAKIIANILGIKAEDVYDILETEEVD